MKISKKSLLRRGYPIHAYVGPNGGGKTLAAVLDAIPSIAAGKKIVSTCRILDPVTGEPHPQWVPLDSYRTLLEVYDAHIILDEVAGVASSRQAMSMPVQIQKRLQELRRRRSMLAWTAPAWARADAIIKECSQAVTLCQGFLPEDATDENGDAMLWRPKRLFLWRTYDAGMFDEWSANQRTNVKPVARQLFWRPGKQVQNYYDTLDAVLSLDEFDEFGRCIECGGNKPRPRCNGHEPVTPLEVVSDPVELVQVPETDDTPAIAVEVPADDPSPVYALS